MTEAPQRPPSRLPEADWQLSMHISPRPRRADLEGLRSLLVHRLQPGAKAVWRRALRGSATSAYCEPCRQWSPAMPALAWVCKSCQRRYVAELVVYREVVELCPRCQQGVVADRESGLCLACQGKSPLNDSEP